MGVVRLLLPHTIGPRQQRSQGLIGMARFAANVANQPAHVGAELSQTTAHALVLPSMGVTTGFHRRDPFEAQGMLAHPQVRLP